jgi:tetratricopeptide (TPR) repeat protein
MKALRYLPLLVLAACGGGTEVPAPESKVAPPGTVERIRTQEDSLFNRLGSDQRGALALLGVYKVFADSFPQDTMAPEYLFRAAGLSKALGQAAQGVTLYDRIIVNYPDWRKIASTYYMKAFTIDDGLDDTAAARIAYQQVIDKFPDHPFARDARAMIGNLRYSDEELIARFKAMNPDTGAVAAGE